MASFRPRYPSQGLLGCALALAIIGIGLPSKAASDGGESAQDLRLDLMVQEWNAAAEAYRRDHGRWPGLQPGPMLERPASVEQLREDLLSRKRPAPPYLAEWPVHPLTGSTNVRVLDGNSTLSDNALIPGWIWRPDLGQIRSDPRVLQPPANRSW